MRRANGLRDYVLATADDSVPLVRERVPYAAFSVRVSLAGIEPVGFRVELASPISHKAFAASHANAGLCSAQP